MDGKESKEDVLSEKLNALHARHTELEEEKLKLCEQQHKVKDDHNKAEQLPEKSSKQLELVATMHAQVQAQHAESVRQLEERDAELQRKQQGVRQLENQYSLLMGELERMGYGVEAWEQNIDSVQKEVSMKRLEAEQILSEQVCSCLLWVSVTCGQQFRLDTCLADAGELCTLRM
jgi:chromosome segregation ATPase